MRGRESGDPLAPEGGAEDAATPIGDDGGATLELRYSASILPGEESNACVLADGPDSDTWVSGWAAHLSLVHHAGVWMLAPGVTLDANGGCGAPGARLLFTALTPQFEEHVPVPGGAVRIAGGTRFALDIHKLSSLDAPAVATASLSLEIASSHTLEVFTGYADGKKISVPPYTKQVAQFSCAVPAGIRVLSIVDHTHSHTLFVSASTNGREIYRSTSWAEPAVQYYEPFDPDLLGWSCEILNDTATTLVYGPKRDVNEMCQVYFLLLGADWHCAI